MFGSKRPESDTNNNYKSSSTSSVNLLAADTTFEGKAKSEGDIRIDGTYKGDLNCQAKVIIGPSGHFEGTIQCINAVIEGQFTGNLQVKELLEVRDSGKIKGDISTGKLMVQAGALFDVQCHMGSNASNSTNAHIAKQSNHVKADPVS
jgi:cytoskeletal protein CcmA (bactofilin family)